MKKTIFALLTVACLFFMSGCEYLDRFIYKNDIAVTDFEFDYTYVEGEHIMVDIVALCDMRDASVRVEFYSSTNPEQHTEGGGAYNFDLSAGESLNYGGYLLQNGDTYDSARLIVISGKKK